MRKRGFTLVELAVVIGVIALLVALLLPVLNKTREQARAVQCAANMRTLLSAAASYAADNDQRYPLPSLVNEVYNKATLPVNFSCPSKGIIDYSSGSLLQYIGPSVSLRQRVMNCPSDLESVRLVRLGTLDMLPRNFSYSFNVQLRAKKTTPTNTDRGGIRITDIANPGHKVILVEEHHPNDQCAYLCADDSGGGDADDVPADRHLGRSMMGFADGHVEPFLLGDLGYSPTFTVADVKLNRSWCHLFRP